MDVDTLSRIFANHLAYLQLMSSLEPGEGNVTKPTVNSILNEALDFYKTTDEKGLQSKAPALLEAFEPIVERFKSLAPLKVSFETIASDFDSLCANTKDIYSFGIEYRWLVERMECSRLGFPSDLPWHTRIGVGHHAGRTSIEERFLLDDAFFMLTSAEEAFVNMNELANKLNKYGAKHFPLNLNGIYLANSDVAAYSRLCIVSFFSFIEAFVNSVGYDFYSRNLNLLNSTELEIMQGKKKGKFISIEYKIEKYPSIIRLDRRSPIVLSDSAQMKDPFKSFIQQIKLIRDSSVHFAPQKEAIWKKPLDWLESARSASRLCIDVAKEFWKACYPDRNPPQYLGYLEYDQLIASADERLKAQNDILIFLQDDRNLGDHS